MLEHHHAPLDGLRGSLTSSENLFDDQKRRIEQAFALRSIDKFGNSEQTCIAVNVSGAAGYHDFMDYAFWSC